MEEIRALYNSSGTEIFTILEPTFNIYIPHITNNKDAILSIPSKTEPYGSHPRQKLDIYTSPNASKDSPILVFFYGGGLVRGDKIYPQFPLVYHNLGAFFASRGLTTVIPDYRRVNSPLGGEDAVFPSGGEDVSLALKWVEKYVAKEGGKKDVFIMGNSAGGVHISTFLFENKFLEQRKDYSSGGESSIMLKGAIELAVPCHFNAAGENRVGMLEAYFGSKQDVKERCPYGALEILAKTGKSREEVGVPKVLALLGELDPEDEIGTPMKDFVEFWKEAWGEGIDFQIIQGHNHISPPWALMSGEAASEKWGEDVLKWIKS